MDNQKKFEEFLMEIGVPTEIILKFADEKIECSTVLLMTDDDLKVFLPKLGDRVAVKNFCRNTLSNKRTGLIDKLREKLLKKESFSSLEAVKIPSQKKTIRNRKIEIGWLEWNHKESRYRQIRQKSGGGTRRIALPKDAKCMQILEEGKTLFFPDGKSKRGEIELFYIELLDYKNNKFDTNLSIQEMYELSKLSTLRFYLASTLKNPSSMPSSKCNNDADYIPATITVPNENEEITEPREERRRSKRARSANMENLTELESFITSYNPDGDSTISEIISIPYQHETNEEETATFQTSPELILFSIDNDLPENIYELPATLVPEIKDDFTNLTLHRSNIFKELICAFKTSTCTLANTLINIVLPNGDVERAQDNGGVLRDVLSEFWDNFYETCTFGTTYKVPYIRHDFGEADWKAIGRILINGWLLENYFPIKIAPVFIKHSLKHVATDDELLDNFLNFVSDVESDLIKKALVDFNSVEYEDIEEFFSSYDSKWIPLEQNLRKLLTDIAHKELIQKPAFVSECFNFEFLVQNIDFDIADIYRNRNPSAKNIMSKLNCAEELNSEQTKTFGYLKKYIRESDSKLRAAFLRFCTGADLITDIITVNFNDQEGFSRRPMAHTCSRHLDLPITYKNFLEFRNEFNNILTSNVWVMDLI